MVGASRFGDLRNKFDIAKYRKMNKTGKAEFISNLRKFL